MGGSDRGTKGRARLARLRSRPDRAAILTDFDGTLAPIVDDPEAARPLEGTAEVLDQLAGHYGCVGVVSGRPVEFLATHLPFSLLLAGLYGLESLKSGDRTDHPSAGVWRDVISDVVAISNAHGPEGMAVESKGLSLTFHYRTRPEIAGAVEKWAARQAARSGLLARPARMSYELHPPIETDKGTMVRELAEQCEAVCFLGDDNGDLRAFDMLDELADEGAWTVRVGVKSEEAPDELLERADIVVDGPEGVLEVLRSLIPDQSAGRAAS